MLDQVEGDLWLRPGSFTNSYQISPSLLVLYPHLNNEEIE